MAAPHDSVENSHVAGALSQPVCGSAANGTPPMTYGSQVGTCPEATDRPRKQKWGSQSESRSGFWVVINPPNAKRCRTTRTIATIASGPANARVAAPNGRAIVFDVPPSLAMPRVWSSPTSRDHRQFARRPFGRDDRSRELVDEDAAEGDGLHPEM